MSSKRDGAWERGSEPGAQSRRLLPSLLGMASDAACGQLLRGLASGGGWNVVSGSVWPPGLISSALTSIPECEGGCPRGLGDGEALEVPVRVGPTGRTSAGD